MMSFRDWISYRLGSSVLSARPFALSGGNDGAGRGDGDGAAQSEFVETVSANRFRSNDIHTSDSEVTSNPHIGTMSYESDLDNTKSDPLKHVEALQIKFLRLMHRTGVPPTSDVVAQVLYRLHLANLIKAGESDTKRTNLAINKARIIAAEQEAAGGPDLDLPLRILLLGKTGVGKSATINSIFDEAKVATNALAPATERIRRIEGTIKGIRVTVIDTPGLTPHYHSQRRNRKILHAIKHFIKRSPPDIVLYFERLDHINSRYSEYPLLKLITDILGSSMWFNTVLVMTHCSSSPPEGPDGYPLEYDAYARYCKNVVLRHIQVAASNTQMENPVILVDNHPMCRRNIKGERVLPNGKVWVSELLLLCGATKLLAEANSLLKFQDSFLLSQANTRLPSLPHLLSSLLKPHSSSRSDGLDTLMTELSDDEDESDQLPPFRVLKKSEYEKLTKEQRSAYLDELDYRETLYLKKQWKEGIRRQKLAESQNVEASNAIGDDYDESTSPEVVHMSDMEIPLSFDSDYPVHRYRYLITDDQVFRPVLDTQGWDHDIGFDGINFEASQDLPKNITASIAGQMRKDKEDMYVQSECSVSYSNKNGHSLIGGMDMQTASKDLVCTIHGDAKIRNLPWNTTEGGISVTKFGTKYFSGAKLEDSITIGRRIQLVGNAGRMVGCGQVANGGGLEMTLRGKDYPVREDSITVAATALSFEKETVIGANLQSDFRVGRGSKMSFSANLNSRNLGRLSIKTSTSDHSEIALIGAVTLFQFFLRRRAASTDKGEQQFDT
ncbi:translocase of chloroplast 90, chloroplastic [Oryza brachyantha]|uniref:AIG1-type G domain-containing protein n=1 Tax=Oryza brachyantha TaxID=4533 RepID=J3NC28_ORYBR|nr:translocase of chloroplast 90, chloroplastic [Oryza brachyantha]